MKATVIDGKEPIGITVDSVRGNATDDVAARRLNSPEESDLKGCILEDCVLLNRIRMDRRRNELGS